MANFRKMKTDKLHTNLSLGQAKNAVFHKNVPKTLRQEQIEQTEEKIAYDNFLDDEIVPLYYEEIVEE